MNDLNQRLSREADGFARRGGTELDISQVLERAGEIRRGRRLRATLVMAACVLAIAVPAVLVASDRDAGRPPAPAHVVRVDRSPLALSGLHAGSAPRIGYALDGRLHLDGFGYDSNGERFVALAAFRGGVLVATSDDQGNLRARRLDSVRSWPMSGGFVTSADGVVAAFVRPDGTPVVVRQEGELTLPRIGAGDGSSAVAVGEECARPSGEGCRVWANGSGARPSFWISYAGATAHRVDTDLRSVVGMDGSEHVAGAVSVSDTGSCSAVETVDGTTLWRTCEHSLGAFSPDGQQLLAADAQRDGAGDREVAILDASNGDVVLDLGTAGEAFVQQAVWEDPGHVLVTLSDSGRWAVVRVGLDGRREYAVAPVAGADPYESPFVLQTR